MFDDKTSHIKCQENFDGFVKSRFVPVFVIPAKAGIQVLEIVVVSN
jgi:hypothetical protein